MERDRQGDGKLITDEVMKVRNEKKWKVSLAEEAEMKLQLQKCSDYWEPDVVELLDTKDDPEPEEAEEEEEEEDNEDEDE